MEIVRRFWILGLLLILLMCDVSEMRAQNITAPEIFTALKNGFNSGDVSLFVPYLSEETYVSLFNGYSGYFSEGQLYYVLKNFIKFFSPLRLRFTHVVTNSDTPYGWGELRYYYRAKRKIAKVFVSLKKKKGKLIIVQLTID